MKPWFAPWRWVYRPVSIPGWIVTLIVAWFCVHVFNVIDSTSGSASDTFYGIFPFFVPALTIWYWIASHTS